MPSLGRFNTYLFVKDGKLMADNVDCCCAPGCEPPTQWAIVDYTNDLDFLLVGNCTANARPPNGPGGGFMEGFPTHWRTRGYKHSSNPIKVGLFFFCPSINKWLKSATEFWEVTHNQCCDGAWWDDHNLPATQKDACCQEDWVGRNPIQFGEQFASTFLGTIDDEWSNMNNWAGGNPWELKLPDNTINVTVQNHVRSDATCSAASKALTVGFVASQNYLEWGIEIDAAGDVGLVIVRVLNDANNSRCAIRGVVNSDKTISGGKVENFGTLKAQLDVSLDQSVNKSGGYVESITKHVTFAQSLNHGEVKAGAAEPPSCDGSVIAPIVFGQGSENSTDCMIRSYVRFEGNAINTTASGDVFDGTVEFIDTSENRGFIDTATTVRFCGDSQNSNTGTVYGTTTSPASLTVHFYDDSWNLGTVFAEVGMTADVAFYDDSRNKQNDALRLINGSVTAEEINFNDNSQNQGRLEGDEVIFNDHAQNGGQRPAPWSSEYYDVTGGVTGAGVFTTKATFRDDSKNYTKAFCYAPAEFWNNSVNDGTVNATATFNDQSKNNGTRAASINGFTSGVTGLAVFNDQSKNAGDVDGSEFHDSAINDTGAQVFGTGSFYDSSQNLGSVQSATFGDASSNAGTVVYNATFNNTSSNAGTVQQDATFNDASSNNGTVNGTITCNTTGTCP